MNDAPKISVSSFLRLRWKGKGNEGRKRLKIVRLVKNGEKEEMTGNNLGGGGFRKKED